MANQQRPQPGGSQPEVKLSHDDYVAMMSTNPLALLVHSSSCPDCLILIPAALNLLTRVKAHGQTIETVTAWLEGQQPQPTATATVAQTTTTVAQQSTATPAKKSWLRELKEGVWD